MVDFHDRRKGPVSDVLAGLYGNGTRYRVSTAIQENGADGPVHGEGHLAPGDVENTVQIKGSTRSKNAWSLNHAHITKIEEARAARDGSRNVLYERPAHRQSGYGRT